MDESEKPKFDEERIAPPVDSEEHDKILHRCLDQVTNAERLHERLMPQWIDNYKAYRGWPTRGSVKKKEDWQSEVRSPYIYEQIMTLLPRVVEGRPKFDVVSASASSMDKDILSAQKRYLAHSLWRDQFPLKASQALLPALICGVGFSTQSWKHRTIGRDVMNRETGKVERLQLTTDARPTMDALHPFDAMWDPDATHLANARYMVLRKVTTVGQVKAKQRKVCRNKEGVEYWKGQYDNTSEVEANNFSDKNLPFPNKIDIPATLKGRLNNKVELLTILDRERDRVTVIANRGIVLQNMESPYMHGDLPVACAITTPDIGNLNGISEVSMMKALQEMLHTLEHSRLDNTRLQMDMVMLIRDTVEDMDDIVTGPGVKIPVRDPSDIQILDYPQPQLASTGDIQALQARLQAVAGSAYMAGGGQGDGMGVSQDTASGLMAIIEEGNRRVDFRLNLIRSMFYETIGQQFASLGGQFLKDNQFIPGATSGADPILVTPQQLAADTWVRVKFENETGLKSMKMQFAQTLSNMLLPLLGMPFPTENGIKEVNPTAIIESIAESGDLEADGLIIDSPQAAAMAAQGAPEGSIPEDPMGVSMAGM